jgi:hypothetical protein
MRESLRIGDNVAAFTNVELDLSGSIAPERVTGANFVVSRQRCPVSRRHRRQCADVVMGDALRGSGGFADRLCQRVQPDACRSWWERAAHADRVEAGLGKIGIRIETRLMRLMLTTIAFRFFISAPGGLACQRRWHYRKQRSLKSGWTDLRTGPAAC